MERLLSKGFFERDPAVVAEELLGKVIIRNLEGSILKGMIVETEAYYGAEDPASRARRGKLPHNRLMWEDPGTVFVYVVHGNNLFNVVTMPRGIPSAILIRAVRPLEGIDTMMRNRKVKDLRNLANGPGKLCEALGITRDLNGLKVYDPKSPLRIVDSGITGLEVARSHRIGVREDLETPLRFYVRGSEFVSRKTPSRHKSLL